MLWLTQAPSSMKRPKSERKHQWFTLATKILKIRASKWITCFLGVTSRRTTLQRVELACLNGYTCLPFLSCVLSKLRTRIFETYNALKVAFLYGNHVDRYKPSLLFQKYTSSKAVGSFLGCQQLEFQESATLWSDVIRRRSYTPYLRSPKIHRIGQDW